MTNPEPQIPPTIKLPADESVFERQKWAAEQFRQAQVVTLNTSAAGAGLNLAVIGAHDLWAKGAAPSYVNVAIVSLVVAIALSIPMHLMSSARYAGLVRRLSKGETDIFDEFFEWYFPVKALGGLQLVASVIGTIVVVACAWRDA